jgi:hypothetical protein
MVLCSHKIDVEKYNDIMITKLFYDSIIYLIDIHSNTFEVEKLDTIVNNPHFNLLKKFAINAKVMLIENINIALLQNAF